MPCACIIRMKRKLELSKRVAERRGARWTSDWNEIDLLKGPVVLWELYLWVIKKETYLHTLFITGTHVLVFCSSTAKTQAGS